MSEWGISEQKLKDIKKRMRRLKIYERDIKEIFVRSSGPGGQNVNKVSTCVVLEHVPTGIQVKYQKHRTQAMNRQAARFLLVDKIAKMHETAQQKIVQQIQKIKRQNKRPTKVSKEKTLEEKRQRSEKKSNRKRISPNSMDDYI